MKTTRHWMMRILGAAMICSMLLLAGACDVQHPPDNTITILGVAIAF